MFNRTFTMLGVAMLFASLAGCTGSAGSANRVRVYKTTGKVTYVGSPLIGAIVTFAPQDNQPAAIGRTNDAGEFSLTTYTAGDGAAAGSYKVMVALPDAGASAAPQEAHSTEPGWTPPSSHSAQTSKAAGSLLPAKYADVKQTPLEAKVDPNGSNNFPLELK